MSKINSLLSERMKSPKEKFSKMTNLAEMSSSGNLSSFSGVFRVSSLTAKEKEALEGILTIFRSEGKEIEEDLASLVAITSEVKAINNQAAILHGERIKKAQEILKGYRDGAFSAWLVATYGNRQTPYNFLQYYELYLALPQLLHPKLDEMPRQAVYILASRNGDLEKKEALVRNYQGQPKNELISQIRDTFPLSKNDKRAQNLAEVAISTLTKLCQTIDHPNFSPSKKQQKTLRHLLKSLHTLAGRNDHT